MERSFLIQAPKDSTVTRGLAISLRNLGQAHMDAEAFDQARQPLEEARDLMESLLEDQGAQRDFVFIAATVLDPLGWLDWQMGLPVRAGARSSRTLDLLRSVEPDEHTARYLEVLAAAEAHAAIITRAPGPGDDSGNATEDRR